MSEVNEAMMYECVSEIYYSRVFREYTDTQVSVFETCQCLLKSFYQRELHWKLQDNKLVILSFGNLVHEALREPLERRGFKHELEGVIPVNGVELFAHGDAVRDDCGIDHKTCSTLPHEPLSHHYAQCNAYMHVFNKPKWYLNYVHKPSGMIKVFPLIPNEDAFKVNCLRAVRLSHCLRTKTMPQPEVDWLCRYCEYKPICPAWRR
jgi:CRISPR/Cas system-associated exonuclease Cas4 (RecB family)